MALSLSRVMLGSQQASVLQQVSLCAGTQSIRWRIRKRKDWLIKDQRDTSWTEPLFEYQKERAATVQEEPVALHVVRRVQPLKGRPWWEKKVLERLGLLVKINKPVIHKNSPSVNTLLREVKHLVQIQPLKFPHGFPDDPRDYPHTILKTTGELIVKKTVDPLSIENANEDSATGKTDKQRWALQNDTVQRELKRKMASFEIHEEYVKPHYTYTRNQDGKEYRYTQRFNKPSED